MNGHGRRVLAGMAAVAASARQWLGRRPSGWERCWIWPVVISSLILLQHWSYLTRPHLLEDAPRIHEVTGFHEASLYDYGMYYWGLVPVYSLDVLERPRGDETLYSTEEAERILVERGHTLRMEHKITLRTGERMLRVMKYPLARFKGSAFRLRHDIVIGGVYALGLILLTLALWRYAPFPLCIFLPLLLGSSGFAAADIYRSQRPLTVLIIAPIYAIALLAPVVFDRPLRTRSLLLRLVTLSAVLVFLIELRRTPLALIPSLVVVLVMYRGRGFTWKIAQVTCFLVSFFALSWSFDSWWDHKYRETSRIVEELGGVPFRMRVDPHHDIWHSIYIGFDDFDSKYGFRWRDHTAHQYAQPILVERGFERTEDEQRYGVLWQKVPGYEKIIRARLLEIVRDDPGWYIEIVRKRIGRILWENEAPRLNLVFGSVVLPSTPWPYLLLAMALLIIRAMPFLKLLILAVPTASVPLLVTTYSGQQHLSVTHLVLAAMLLTACWSLGAASLHLMRGAVGAKR